MIQLNDIPSGFYSITETKTIDGYLLNDKTETVKVTGGIVKEVTIQNDPLGGLLIRVINENTKKPLSEATVKVTTSDGSVFALDVESSALEVPLPTGKSPGFGEPPPPGGGSLSSGGSPPSLYGASNSSITRCIRL